MRSLKTVKQKVSYPHIIIFGYAKVYLFKIVSFFAYPISII
jgi:hypothetical protein